VSSAPPGAPEIIAHRGYSARAPENTLAALTRAIEAGADAIEWDVQLTACGTPVVIHDETLERTSEGRGPVRAHTLEQLRALDFGRWFGPEFTGERIPTLAEALELTRGRVGRVYTEIKAGAEPDEVDRILQLVREADRIDDNVFISFDWGTLARIAEREERARIGYILDRPQRFDEALERASSDERSILDLDHRIVLTEPALARRSVERGVPVAVWTVNDAVHAEILRHAGVTRFTTNRVEELIAWRDGAA
jgi:glycerophosphoryl diester phosphodiesterase